MAIDIPQNEQEEKAFDANLGGIETALQEARSKLSALTDAASAADSVTDDSDADYSLHEVQGIGRYAVVRKTGWRALLKVIHDLSANIDFSANAYPTFDKVIADQFASPHLQDPLDDKYESYQSLRDNLSAVRNFLMETYYVDTPAGMTPEKAKQAMTEIATYIGKGLDNNYLFLGMLPNHRIGKPFIDLEEASAPGGAGAQYIYERILEMHRQSSWMRPFSAVISLFGGHSPPDWMLPPAHETEFTQLFSNDIAHGAPQKGPLPGTLKEGIVAVEALEAARGKLIDQHQVNNSARDLSSLGDQLIYSASHMQDVTALGEPVRREAIEIAKDILRKLRGSLGSIDIKNGLNLPPKDDISTLGSIKGVSLIYERMVGWARNANPGIMQHPSVISGVQAIGQLGFLAKQEALRLAKVAGNTKLAEEIGGQLAKIDPAFSVTSDIKFSALMDRIESGINVLLSRVQTISGPGAQIGNSSRDVGQGMSQAPTAGNAQQVSNSGKQNDAAKLNAEMVAAQNAFQQAQQARQSKQSSTTTRSTLNVTTTSTAAPAQQPQRSSSSRSIFQQFRQSRSSSSAATTASTAPVSSTQRSNTAKPSSTDMARIARQQQERDEEIRLQRVAEQQRLQAQKASAKAAVKKINPNMLDAGLMKRFQGAVNTQGLGPVMPVKKVITPATAQPTQPKQPLSQTAPKTPGMPDDHTSPTTPTPYGRGGRGM